MKKENINQRIINYKDLASLEKDHYLKKLSSEESGLTINQVEKMRDQYGVNEITQQDQDTIFKQLFEAFINPFSVVLLVLALISFITDVVLPSTGNKDYTAVIIVLTMVILSGILRFIQERKSNAAAEKLSQLVKTTTGVIRDAQGLKEVSLSEVVVGDIIQLAAGDIIPADARVIQAKDLFISQSSLTGESEPIEKQVENKNESASAAFEYDNLIFMGSSVISGSAKCCVFAVGDDTVFGGIAHNLTEEKVVTSFEKGVNSVTWLLIRFMMVMVPFVLFVNGFTKGDWVEAFLFAISIAVGLTPEMLPMIVTSNLAKGAVSMSKQKTVVKNINAIQNFGAMDVLCTDKTGTLTQDKVVLENYLDVHGQANSRVLRHAFINSYFQTGLKNLMDLAIISHKDESEMQEIINKYQKIDEIPFDFTRRRMSVVVADHNNKTQLITKGAVEEMISISSHVEYNNQVVELTDKIKNEILKVVTELNHQGMRVIAVAQKTNPSTVDVFSIQDESQMVLMGYLAFLDPPKASAKDAIRALSEYGVATKVLTGDNDAVTKTVCEQMDFDVSAILLGSDIEMMNDQELSVAVEETNIFAKLSPIQKVRIVGALRDNGHTVGFLGDGINDAAAMKKADVGISVDTAVDIAKESADIILLEKDLMVLERGVIEGRRTFANIIKYIKMTVSSNFGNMFSVLVASALLPFLPMLPIQLLALNLIYDISCIAIPWDNVDEEYLKVPRKWEADSIKSFMLWIGPTSSIFDIITFLVMFFIIAPIAVNGQFNDYGINQELFAQTFNSGWFVISLWTQTLVIHMIRTPKIPFIQSRASNTLIVLTTISILIGTIIPFTVVGTRLSMAPLPFEFIYLLVGVIIGYMVLVTIVKKIYIKKFKELL